MNILIRLDGPISHNEIGADMGNITLFRRMARVVDGRVQRIPVISAGALRGGVRRLLWRETFDLCGLSRETVGSPAWDRLYAALANGGTIEAAETRITPDVIRARRAALPVLSLLGAALYTSHMAGRLQLSHAWIVCQELGGTIPADELLAEISTVRHADAEEQNPDVSHVGPMPTTVEVAIAGATFQARAHVGGELEASAWAHGLDLVRTIGGKSGQGNGAVRVEHDGDGALYVAWLAEHRDAVRKYLLQLADELATGGRSKKNKAADRKAAKPPDAAEETF